jgi:hypothetical protein
MSIGRSEQLATSAAHQKNKLTAEILKLEMPMLSLSFLPSLGPQVAPKMNILQDPGCAMVARMSIGRSERLAISAARQKNKLTVELLKEDKLVPPLSMPPSLGPNVVLKVDILQDRGYVPVARMLIGHSEQLAISAAHQKRTSMVELLKLKVLHLDRQL